MRASFCVSNPNRTARDGDVFKTKMTEVQIALQNSTDSLLKNEIALSSSYIFLHFFFSSNEKR